MPPNPNALRPATRSAGGASHGRGSFRKANGLVSGSQALFGLARLLVGGWTP